MATWQVGFSVDDCVLRYDGSVWYWLPTASDQWVGWGGASTWARGGGGMRFRNVTIPQGATIISAILTLQADYSTSGTIVNSVIIGEDTDNAAAFSTLANYQGRRGSYQGSTDFPAGTPTTAYVNWDNIAAWTDDVDYDSPSIVSVIQEIVNRAGWASGNNMVIFWDDHAGRSTAAGQAYRGAESYDNVPATAPKLVVTYTAVTVATNAATNITTNSAQLNGTLTNTGAEVAYVSFDWGLTSSYGNSTLEEAQLGSGTFNKTIGNNLTPDTTYHFRAVARVGSTYLYGSDLTFRTGTPSVGFPVRVSAIKHLFSAGPEPVYKAEVYIGGLQSSYLPPISDKEPLPSITPRETSEAIKRLGIGRTGTAMSQTNALFQYGVWLSQHTQAQINAIFKHQPTFAEWWAWYQVYGI